MAEATGLAQPNIAAYESGRRPTTATVLERVREATDRRPSTRLAARREEVVALVRAAGGRRVSVFGSTARSDDVNGSDLDLIVEFAPGTSLLDVVCLEDSLRDLLGVSVDVVSAPAVTGRFGDRVVREIVPLA